MKHNNVFLCGWVQSLPSVLKDDKTGEYKRAIGRLVTIRGVRNYGAKQGNIKYDVPFVYSENPEICKQIAQWQVGDMVEIKGSVTTKDINKVTTCPHCNAKNSCPGSAVYINPIFVGVRETGVLSKELAYQKLREIGEISNSATVIGVVCRDPVLYKRGKTKITSYQLAIRRKYRIKQDAVDNKTDFPWVKSYGVIGEHDYDALRKGSYIVLDGWVQSRSFKRTSTCQSCGQEYEWSDWSQELVPFATEYVRNYRTDEEIEKEKAEAEKRAYQRIFGEEEIVQSGPVADVADIEKQLDEYNTYDRKDEYDDGDEDPQQTINDIFSKLT